MTIKRKKRSYDNSGSALITALVVSAVLMVLSLSVLAVSYSLFLSQKKNTGDTSEREMFYSAIEVFEQELLEGGHKVFKASETTDTSDTTGTTDLTETIKANKDDYSLFGTKIVDSIFNFCNNLNPDSVNAIYSDIPKWACFNLNVYNGKSTDEEKAAYIKSVSRYFEMKCYSSYTVGIQMYWEFENSDTEINSVSDEQMKGILLHVVYRLKNNEDTLVKNERVYRLAATKGGALLVEPEDNSSSDTGDGTGVDTEGEGDKKEYTIKFGPINKDPAKYEVDPEFFPDMKVHSENPKYPYVEISKNEWNDNILQQHPYLSWTNWYANTPMTLPWAWDDGTPETLFKNVNGNIGIARTNWNDRVPVRIKFVINGYYVDLDIYAFSYIKFVNNATGIQKFNLSNLNGQLTDGLLEACGINVTDIDNLDTLIWKYEYNKNYYEFFDNKGSDSINRYPLIEYPANNNLNKVYYVYATFPSYYTDGTHTTFKKGITIPKYDATKTISPNDICLYTKYSFERIIGE